jgi:outer membrane protein assembly factor BamB
LIPNDLVSSVTVGATPIHQYDSQLLASVTDLTALPARVQSQLTLLEPTDQLEYRAWSGAAAPVDETELALLGDGYYLLGFIGPADPDWRQQIVSLGIAILDTARPYALLVRGRGNQLIDAARLTSSFGFPVVRTVRRVPLEARVAPELLRLARGELRRDQITGLLLSPAGRAVVRVIAYSDRDPSVIAGQVQAVAQAADTALRRLAGGPADTQDVFVVEGPEILAILERVPGVAYIEPVHQRELHNNLAANDYILNVEPVWNLGYNGSGVMVLHNDSGVDRAHPDFPAGVIVATIGVMSNTDNGHGTHTAGSVAGRGGTCMPPGNVSGCSPVNNSGCGDVGPTLPVVRGMAPGAQLAVNNLFDGGLTGENAMMQWGYQQGARISTNSWGYQGLYSYSFPAVNVDGATRDADSAQAGNQEMLLVFSAGNDGPSASTVIAPGLAKNVITVGASQNDRCGSYYCCTPNINTIATFSSRGPSQGRIKPDVVAVGTDVLSTQSNDPQATHPRDQAWTGSLYELSPGTSMSCPMVAGSAAVFFDFYNTTYGGLPSPALAKAALINGAVDVGLGYPSFSQGWGRINLRRSIEGPPGGKINFIDQPSVTPLATGQAWTQTFNVLSSGLPLKLSVVWTDPPAPAGSTNPLRNNLDLLVTAPNGTIYRGNRFSGAWSIPNPGATTDTANNVENVFVQTPQVGEWTMRVSSASTMVNPPGLSGQDFAVVYSGDASPCPPLAAPSGLSATPVGDNRIDLSWTAVPAATQYRVLRSTVSGGPYAQIATTTLTTFSDTTVSGGVTYYYVVRAAFGASCESGNSNEASATATGECRLAPTFAGLAMVSAPPDACRRLRLDWAPGTSNCGGAGSVVYNVHRSTVSGFTPGPANRIATCVTDLFYEDTTIVGGTTYYYVVRAEDSTIGGGGPCNGGNEDANLVERSGVAGTDVLYSNDFESGSGLADWGRGTFGGDPAGDWKGIQTCAPARSGSRIFRFGGNSCNARYTVNQFEFAEPATATGIAVPPGAGNVRLSFWHRWAWESDAANDYDGGQIRVSLNHSTYTVVPASAILQNAYDSTSTFGCRPNGSGNQPMWGDDRSSFINTVVDLDAVCNLIAGGNSGCAGRTLWIAFTAMTDCAFTDFGWFIDDVQVTADTGGACGTKPNPVQFFTSTSKDGQNKLEWVNPASGGYASTLIRVRTDQFPTGPSDGALVVDKTGSLGAKDSFVHTAANDTTHYYAAFVKNAVNGSSSAMTVRGRPQATSGDVKWVYNTGASAVTAPSIGSVFGVSNDRVFHSMNQGASGGDWPGPFFPFIFNQPVQGRSPVAPVPVGGASKIALVGSQDGHVYIINAVTGAQVAKSPKLGDMIQAAPAAIFTQFGGAIDQILVGTRNSSSENRFYGLNLTDGSIAWSFDNGGGSNGIGIISGQASVDYPNQRVYFASRQLAGGSLNTVWCLKFTASSANLLWARDLGHIDGSPVLRNGKVYVGTNGSEVHALDPATGNSVWAAPFNAGDGMVKGFIWVASATDLYLSTTNTILSLNDNGTTVSENWRVTSIPLPSIPLFTPGSHYLLVGSSDGNLYQLDVAVTPPTVKSVKLGDGTATVGSPGLDVANQLLYVGTTAGAIYAVAVPLQ